MRKLLRLELAVWIRSQTSPVKPPKPIKPWRFYPLAATILLGELAFVMWQTGWIRPLAP